MFCRIPNVLQSSLNKEDVKRGSQSEMTHVGIPVYGKALFLKSSAIFSLPIVSSHGSRITTFEQPWSVTVRIELFPFDLGNLTTKSMAMVVKGTAFSSGTMGCRGGMFL